MKQLCLIISLLWISGCTSWHIQSLPNGAGHAASIRSDAARICILRETRMAFAVELPVWDNHVLVGATRGPGHFCYYAKPGFHQFRIRADEDAEAHLSVKAGSEYFLLQEVDNMLGFVKCRPTWIAADRGRRLVAELSPVELIGVPGHEKLPDPRFVVPES